jgi:hypothetical protein
MMAGDDYVRVGATEPLEVQLFDEHRQRRLPRLLPMVAQLTELAGVQPELSRYRHLGMRQPEPSPRVHPHLQLRWQSVSLTRHDHDPVHQAR